MIFANLGRVRPVKLKQAGDDPQEKAHLHEDSDSSVDLKTEHIADVVTDQPGKFPRSGPLANQNALSNGEEHNLKSELERQALQRLSSTIGDIVTREGCPAWDLVVPQTILPRLVKSLPAAARNSLSNTIPGDFTSVPIAELEKRFLNGG